MSSTQHLYQRLQQQLHQRQVAGNLRQLPTGSYRYDFYSNDYLGLAQSVQVQQQAHELLGQWPVANGATGSRLLSGNCSAATETEAMLAAFFEAPAALLFNSGYTANLGLLATLPQRGDVVLYDALSHACIKEGVRLGHAHYYSFRHNDMSHLEAQLQKYAAQPGHVFVVAESIYSMDGDLCPLPQLVALCQQYGAHALLDEAHSTGNIGAAGNGLACHYGLQHKLLARVHTFGKAMGTHGACIVASSEVVQYLMNFCRPFIYTTALPLHSLMGIRAAFAYLQQHPQQIAALHQRVGAFHHALAGAGLPVPAAKLPSPIYALPAPGNQQAKQLAGTLQQQGFGVMPILSPTVKAGTERLRICLHTFNTDEEIGALVNIFAR